MARSESVGPSERLLRWTQYLLLVTAAVIALMLLATGSFLTALGGSILFWRAITWLRVFQKPR